MKYKQNIHEYSTVLHLIVSGCPNRGNIIIQRQSEIRVKSILDMRVGLFMKINGINIAIANINNRFLLSSARAKAGDTDNVIMIKSTSVLCILIYP